VISCRQQLHLQHQLVLTNAFPHAQILDIGSTATVIAMNATKLVGIARMLRVVKGVTYATQPVFLSKILQKPLLLLESPKVQT